jgi:hypothetical protein
MRGKRKGERGGDPRLFIVGSVLAEGLGFGLGKEIGRPGRLPCSGRVPTLEDGDDRWPPGVSD